MQDWLDRCFLLMIIVRGTESTTRDSFGSVDAMIARFLNRSAIFDHFPLLFEQRAIRPMDVDQQNDLVFALLFGPHLDTRAIGQCLLDRCIVTQRQNRAMIFKTVLNHL